MADLGTFNEGTSSVYTAQLKDELGAAIDGTALDSLTLSVMDSDTLTPINSRTNQDVKNTNGVTVTVAGVLTWRMTPADMALLSQTNRRERRTAVFVAKWASSTKQVTHDFTWTVRNLALFPPA